MGILSLVGMDLPPSGPGFVSLVAEVVHTQARLEQVSHLGSGGTTGELWDDGGITWKTYGIIKE